MYFFFRSLLALTYILTASALPSARPLFPLHRRITFSSKPLPPSQDPWYTAPANYELAAPGTILRIRNAPGNLTAITGNCSAAYHILYRTTDTRYRPSWAVTTLFVPLSSHTATNGSGSALLSYQIPYNSVDVDSGPSYASYAGKYADIPAALGRGWFVNVPDFEGPLASMVAGVQEGHATLDSVRAVLSSGFGLASDTRYAMWGYSGGSIASEWAAELQAQYAPELNFVGMAIGGMPIDVQSAVLHVNGTPYAGLIAAGILGITNQFPDAYEFVLSQLKPTGPYNKTTFLAVMQMDTSQYFVAFGFQDMYQYFIHGEAFFQAPILQKVFNSNGRMGYHGLPQMPIFAYKAIGDQLSIVEETDALVNKYCAVGANILYHRNTIGGHGAEAGNEDATAFEWLSSVLDGTYSLKYKPMGCTILNVTIGDNLSPL